MRRILSVPAPVLNKKNYCATALAIGGWTRRGHESDARCMREREQTPESSMSDATNRQKLPEELA